MEARAHHVLIGFFTLAIVAGAMMFGLWLAKSGNEKDTTLYDIVFQEAVTGLSVGSAVQYSGIRVGEVVGLQLDPKDPRQVWARVRVNSSTPVTEDTRARLTIANITGSSIIQFVSGDPDSPLLTARADVIAVIMAEPSPFRQLRVSSEELLMNITRLVENANRVLSEDNARSIDSILQNLVVATEAVAGQGAVIRGGLQDLASASSDVRQTLTETSRLMAQLNRQMEAHGEAIFSNADSTLQNLRSISGSIEGLLASQSQSLNQGMQGVAELGPAVQELRNTLAALSEITRRIEEDPTGYLLGNEKIKEFQP